MLHPPPNPPTAIATPNLLIPFSNHPFTTSQLAAIYLLELRALREGGVGVLLPVIEGLVGLLQGDGGSVWSGVLESYLAAIPDEHLPIDLLTRISSSNHPVAIKALPMLIASDPPPSTLRDIAYASQSIMVVRMIYQAVGCELEECWGTLWGEMVRGRWVVLGEGGVREYDAVEDALGGPTMWSELKGYREERGDVVLVKADGTEMVLGSKDNSRFLDFLEHLFLIPHPHPTIHTHLRPTPAPPTELSRFFAKYPQSAAVRGLAMGLGSVAALLEVLEKEGVVGSRIGKDAERFMRQGV